MRFSYFFLILLFSCASQKKESLTIACAANMEAGIDSIARSFSEKEGVEVEVVSGASGILATQIRSGAPFDLFISADRSFTDELNKEGFTSSSEEYLTSEMVCINLTMANDSSISNLLLNDEVSKIGIADPEVAPFGKAAKKYLEAMSLWEQVEPKLVYAESVSQLNMYIESSTVDVAFTSKSFLAQKEFGYNYIFIEHPTAEVYQYLVEVYHGKDRHPRVKEFHDYLYSEEALSILHYFGY